MKYTGKWKIKQILTFNDKMEREWKDVEALLNDPETDDADKKMLTAFFEFGEDGQLRTLMAIPAGVPQEAVDAAVQSGEIELYGDNMIIMEKHPWKEENGKVLYDTGVRGTTFDEPVDPWDELEEENGMLRMFTYRLVRAE